MDVATAAPAAHAKKVAAEAAAATAKASRARAVTARDAVARVRLSLAAGPSAEDERFAVVRALKELVSAFGAVAAARDLWLNAMTVTCVSPRARRRSARSAADDYADASHGGGEGSCDKGGENMTAKLTAVAALRPAAMVKLHGARGRRS